MDSSPSDSEIQSTPSGTSRTPRRIPKAIGFAHAVVPLWKQVRLDKIGLFIISLFLFVQAIALMKEGARTLAPLLRDGFAGTDLFNCLGFGWLSAYVIMSGSPVAATALTFFDAGVIDELGTFAAITGSRLGASFVVLLIGFIYVLRGRNRATNLSIGLLSLTVTGTIYLAGFIIGIGLLEAGVLDQLRLRPGIPIYSVTDLIFSPLTGALAGFAPGWALFPIGLGIIVASFSLFDRCLPQMALKESHMGHVSRLVYRPWVMFLLGGAITLISMSVSVSLGILVPLGNRGFVRRENVIPYIMGANITTFVDTLMVAVLLNNPPAFTIVLAEIISIALVSVVVLVTFYRRYQHAALAFVSWVTATNRNLALFMLTIFVVPILLMVL
jgi:sodium-dependent phosphate cotransporter